MTHPTMPLRCALYARYSSDRQRAASIEDQFRGRREHAGRLARPASPSAAWAAAGGAAEPADSSVNSGTAQRFGVYRRARCQPAALASASEQNHRSPGRLIFVRA